MAHEVAAPAPKSDAARPANAPALVVAVVLPAYRSAPQIAGVIRRVPAAVDHIIVVDDASPDDLRGALAAVGDPRLVVLHHEQNRGVGAAMKTGIARAIELRADVVVKLDSDGQMDPAMIPRLIAPLQGGADLAKGNRFTDLGLLQGMPFVRRAGNLALSFLVKFASGYWSILDPCNGFLAVRATLLRGIDQRRLADRYFFEISLLCEAYHTRAVLRDVPMPVVYGDEISSLSPFRTLLEFLPRLLGRACRRVSYTYFLLDFNVVSVFLTAGSPLLLFGTLWSAYHWYRSYATGQIATSGTVIIGMLAIVLGFQMLLQAVVLDVQNEPGRQSSSK